MQKSYYVVAIYDRMLATKKRAELKRGYIFRTPDNYIFCVCKNGERWEISDYSSGLLIGSCRTIKACKEKIKGIRDKIDTELKTDFSRECIKLCENAREYLFLTDETIYNIKE